MNTPISNIKPAAVISFEGNATKLRACMHAISSWVSPIIIVHSDSNFEVKEIIEHWYARLLY